MDRLMDALSTSVRKMAVAGLYRSESYWFPLADIRDCLMSEMED
jgi:hypothetical protein